MDTSEPSTAPNIAEETYKGPSAVVAAAGEGYVAHFASLGIGLVVGGGLAYLFHKPVNNVMRSWKNAGVALAESGSRFKKLIGGFSQWLVGHPEGTFSATLSDIERGIGDPKMRGEVTKLVESKEGGIIHVFSHKLISWLPTGWTETVRAKSEARLSAAIMGGGLLGAIGFFGVPFALAPSGAKKGLEGKRQFERLKGEVLDLRAENETLREKYVEEKVAHETETPKPHHPAKTHDAAAAHEHAPHEHAAHREAPKPTLSEVDRHSHGTLAAGHEAALG